MKWKVIRLELASSWEFPKGSAGRSYLIRLPLGEDGAIDAATLELQPTRATVRRYWPNQADMLGYLVHTPTGYAIRYEVHAAEPNGALKPNGNAEPKLIQLGAKSISVGEEILITEPDGNQARFRIASLQ